MIPKITEIRVYNDKSFHSCLVICFVHRKNAESMLIKTKESILNRIFVSRGPGNDGCVYDKMLMNMKNPYPKTT